MPITIQDDLQMVPPHMRGVSHQIAFSSATPPTLGDSPAGSSGLGARPRPMTRESIAPSLGHVAGSAARDAEASLRPVEEQPISST